MPRLAISMAAAFVVAVLALHVLRTDVSPLGRGVSRYAVGNYAYVVNAAFLFLAGALVATGIGFRSTVPQTPVAGVFLLWLGAAGMALVVLYPLRAADSAATENLPHQAGGMLFFLAAVAGAVVLSRRTGRYAALAWFAAAAVSTYFLSIGVPALGLAGVRGLLQRLCFGAIVTWLVAANAAIDRMWRYPES